MEPSALHSQISLFEARNNALYFALGLVSMARSLSEAMNPAVNEPRPLQGTPEPDENGGSTGDPALHFTLGLVALAQRFERILEAEKRTWRQGQTRRLRESEEAANRPQFPPRNLLR